MTQPEVASKVNGGISFFHLNMRSAKNKENELCALFVISVIVLISTCSSRHGTRTMKKLLKHQIIPDFLNKSPHSVWRRVAAPSKR